ncbi:MAG: hypothetical protein R3F42_05530 [Pseudomonadota bacterium]
MKRITLVAIAVAFTLCSRLAPAALLQYTFEGLVTGFQSYHQDYTLTDFDIVVGETPLTYVFVVDFAANQSSFSNGAGTWNYFYTDLVSGSIINGGLSIGNYSGFNWYSTTVPNIGEITSNITDVRILASAATSPDWRVQDWQVGQAFSSIDGACYPGGIGGCAVYAFGDVTLTSIVPVPVPGALVLLLSGITGLLLTARVQAPARRG